MAEDTTTVKQESEAQGDAIVRRETVRREQGSASGVVVAQRVVWFFIGFIVTFLLLRVVLLLLAANQGAPFVDFVYAVGGFFAAPFFGIFSYTPAYGQSVLEISSLVAVVIYVLLGWGIAKLLTLTRPHEEV